MLNGFKRRHQIGIYQRMVQSHKDATGFSLGFHSLGDTQRALKRPIAFATKRDNLVRINDVSQHATLLTEHLFTVKSVFLAAFSTLRFRLLQLRILCTLRTLTWAVLLSLVTLASPSQAEWRMLPSALLFETPHGTLSVRTSEYVYESRLYLDDKPVEPHIQGLLDITYAYQIGNAHAALIAVSDGDAQCAVHYRWIVLDHSGYRVSPAFGSCSRLVMVTAKGSLLTVSTPSTTSPDKIDVYQYDGAQVSKRTRAATAGERLAHPDG